MSILINESYANPNVPVWAAPLPAGLASGLTWSAVGGLYKANITGVYPAMTASTPLSCSLQDASEADGLACWLVKAVPTATANGTITFYLAGNPTSSSTFKLSWAIAK